MTDLLLMQEVYYEFVRALEETEDTGAKVQIEIDGSVFTAIEIVKPHFMRVAKVK